MSTSFSFITLRFDMVKCFIQSLCPSLSFDLEERGSGLEVSSLV